MHVVLGDGVMPKKELTETLADLARKAEEADATFWFLVQGKSEPTETDTSLVAWMHKNEIYYEVITDDVDAMSDIYEQAQERHVAKRLSPKIVKLLETKPEEGEDAAVYALFASDNPEDEADRWLNGVVQAVVEADYKVYALNDGLIEVDLSTPEEAEAEVEETPAPAPVKSAAKKAPAKKAPDVPIPGLEDAVAEAVVTNQTLAREELEELDLDGLKEVAANLGITLPPRTRMTTYIDTILGEGKSAPQVEVDAPSISPLSITSGNGHSTATTAGTTTYSQTGSGNSVTSSNVPATFVVSMPTGETIPMEVFLAQVAEHMAKIVLKTFATIVTE